MYQRKLDAKLKAAAHDAMAHCSVLRQEFRSLSSNSRMRAYKDKCEQQQQQQQQQQQEKQAWL